MRADLRQKRAESRLRNALLAYFKGLRARVVAEAKGAKLTKALLDPYIELLGKYGDVEIWLVNGKWVRKYRYTDFTMDGHDRVYPEFIPSGQIWIDDRLAEDERALVIRHALVERQQMAQGMSYDDAHEWATTREDAARQLEDV
jgi:hypothetical protein